MKKPYVGENTGKAIVKNIKNSFASKDHKHSWDELEDRPFGEELVEIFSETTIDKSMFVSELPGFILPGDPLEFIEGETYKVLYNDKVYESVCHLLEGALHYLGSSQDTYSENEPYMIIDGRLLGINGTCLLTREFLLGTTNGLTDASTWTLGIYKSGGIKYLDPKYIKDMYGSEEKDVIIYETQETSVGTASSPATFEKLGFEVGKTYKVIWNGTEFTCEAFEASMQGMSGVGIGNKAAVGGESTGEPFIIADVIGEAYGVTIDLTAASMDTVTFGVMEVGKEVVVKVPEKYLPEQKENLSEFNNDLYGNIYGLEDIYSAKIADLEVFSEASGFTTYVLLDENDQPAFKIDGEGIEYLIIIDGVEYKCKTVCTYESETNPSYDMGNMSISGAGDDTGEPFCIGYSPLDGVYLGLPLNSTAKNIEVKKIISTDVKQIPKEFVEMPFGEKEVVLLPETTITVSNGQGIASAVVNFEVGKEYVMTVDGVDYPCVGYSANYQGTSFIGVGCKEIFEGKMEGFTEPCAIGTGDLGAGIMTAVTVVDPSVTSITISVRCKEITYIDPKYIKDMYYDNTKVLLPETTLTNEDPLNNTGFKMPYIILASGETYNVNWNGVEYIVTAQTFSQEGITGVAIGDINGIMGGESSGEPFVIACINGECIAVDVISILSSEATVSISQGGIKKIDNKFIDAEWMATQTFGAGIKIYENNFSDFSTDSNNSKFTIFNDDSNLMDSLVIGKEYVVSENGVEYISKARALHYDNDINEEIVGIYLGNSKDFGIDGIVDTGEPFVIVFAGSSSIFNTYSDVTNGIKIIISEYVKVPNKIPVEYLPEATQSSAGVMSAEDKTQLDHGGIPIVTTEGDGSAYTATVDGITALTVGAKITIIPHTRSTAFAPTLNVNGLGAKAIRMPVTYNTSTTSNGPIEGWVVANKPVTVQYDGSYWVTIDVPRPSAQYLYGAVPIANGGTGATTVDAALSNLSIGSLANLKTTAKTSIVDAINELYDLIMSLNQ